ncbi:asparagine synthetase B [Acrocarpospora pleiomorpha]|uniref:asparagine synthase (glutamine-hydrolyzing) n=1 Tax=Acrocarpospora pleiomorpha TaxID=90975 RepID=A0A5M3XKE1_9ACTN|nr:asparagine synthase (glutamine-hydrolyzing) [Acrocarpospora pleiomorpha]GES20111.1 asparagine synthetase B [Acrocarpospora pleiomorpha]
MCGIAGWVSYDADLTERQATIDAMTATMALRGPDASGTWVERHVALGHRRLAVIDLDGGVQPMEFATPNGPVVLIYTGEAYNFIELRKELQARGHRFRTSSDTEVVLHGYLEWGESVTEHLNGMYAFAIWDARDQKLVLIRDRLGVKPLFYYPTGDGVLFGSEPKAILANPLARKAVDINGIRSAVLAAGGQSIWKGMHEVEPGTVVTVKSSGIHTRTYWKLRTAPHTDDQKSTVERIRELLDDTVNRQLISDVRQCVLLSGGLDSSAIASLASRKLTAKGDRVRTFSVDFVDHVDRFRPDAFRTTPDAPFVKDMVDMIGPVHQQVVLSAENLSDPAVRRAVITARDTPSGLGESDISMYLLFQAIRGESTVALSGEAADENFGGYQWFHNNIREIPIFPWMAALLSAQAGNPALMPFTAEALAAMKLETYLGDEYRTAVAAVDHLDNASRIERQMRVMFHMHLTRFLRMLLDRKDRLSMAAGLEVRVPFCDHRLVEYVYNTPWKLKSFDGREKSLLRHAVKDLLPPSVLNRKKSGYPTMMHDSRFSNALLLEAKEVLAEPHNPLFTLFNRKWVQSVVETDSSKIAHGEKLLLDKMIDMYYWIDIYSPELSLS